VATNKGRIIPLNNKYMELTELDQEVIAEQIKEGFTSGRCDGEDYCIAWELKTNKW